jgi:hypothetical protein
MIPPPGLLPKDQILQTSLFLLQNRKRLSCIIYAGVSRQVDENCLLVDFLGEITYWLLYNWAKNAEGHDMTRVPPCGAR